MSERKSLHFKVVAHFFTQPDSPPAPEPGAKLIHMGSSPILAQAFSEPFTVYSAKRFPGVPGMFRYHRISCVSI